MKTWFSRFVSLFHFFKNTCKLFIAMSWRSVRLRQLSLAWRANGLTGMLAPQEAAASLCQRGTNPPIWLETERGAAKELCRS